MRIRKAILGIISMVLTTISLTGCVGMESEIIVDADGSAVIKGTTGINEKFLLDNPDTKPQVSGTGVQGTYNINGENYVGEMVERRYSSLEDLQLFLRDNYIQATTLEGSAVNPLWCNIEMVDDCYKITVKMDNIIDQKQYIVNEADITVSELDEFIEAYPFNSIFKLKLPANVHQISGPTDGVTIEGNTVKIECSNENLMNLDGYIYLDFKTDPIKNNTEINEVGGNSNFRDVKESDWYYNAVTKLVSDGIVKGKGKGLFDPNGTITVAELATLFSRIDDSYVANGGNSGYWAYNALDWCISMGYIKYRGDITSDNYDVVVKRDEAIGNLSRLWLQEKNGLYTSKIAIRDIPDYETISPEYQTDIAIAYTYGITKGVDASGRFNGGKTLSRAEMCQMLYNALYL